MTPPLDTLGLINIRPTHCRNSTPQIDCMRNLISWICQVIYFPYPRMVYENDESNQPVPQQRLI